MSTAEQLFKSAAPLLTLADAIIPIAAKHTYTFVSDGWYQGWCPPLLQGCQVQL
jgi:hypothetical protein